MRFLSILAFLVFSISCTKKAPLDGPWDMYVSIQNKQIPFQLVFKPDQKVDLINGAETIPLSYEVKDDTISIPILNYDAELVLEQKKDLLGGHWIRANKTPAYKEAVAGEKAKSLSTLPELEIPPKWRIELLEPDSKTDGILIFTQKGDGKFASVLTPTGDYRFLTPRLEGEDKLILTGFDGIFAFYFEGTWIGETYVGNMYSGKSWNQPFQAVADKNFELPDPTTATKFKGSLEKIKLPLLGGGEAEIINENNKNKVKVIQIFGSWCPNCIDETRFIKQWRKENANKDVSFSMIAFERSPDKKHALKMLKKAKELHGVDYPIYIGGYTAQDKVSSTLPGLENFISFPTTLFVDKKNNVRKIHAGFTGPATGKYYEKFVLDFNSLIDKLLAE